MKIKYLSIIRENEYQKLQELSLSGEILDVGGSRRSGYHQLIKGENNFTVINIDEKCEPDHFVDIEKEYPFEDEKFDHAICLNVMEHVFEFQNVFSEQVRCVKTGGRIVIAAPFMFHVHGSPDDYIRYTSSSYKRLAEKFNCEIESIDTLGGGFFSLGFQTIGGAIPTRQLQLVFKTLSVFLDKFFCKISSKYRKLSSRIPLGYFVVFKKL